MARTALTAQATSTAGLAATYGAANVDGHMFVPQAGRVLHVKNGGGAPITVTVQAEVSLDGLALPDQTVAVANGAETFIGPFASDIYAQRAGADKGKVYVDFSAVTSVTLALIDTE